MRVCPKCREGFIQRDYDTYLRKFLERCFTVATLPIDQIVCGDAFEVLKSWPENSVDTVMFSPPYWGLRDYKIPKVDDCFAVGGLGLESHPKEYVNRMVVLCRLLRRVLKREGSMFINLGDTYFGSMNWTEEWTNKQQYHPEEPLRQKMPQNKGWLQPKQLLLIPSRVAIALQEDGWILRNDVVWHKPNHMPSSVKDRLTNSWEHIFHFVKNRRYFYDLDAIREPHRATTQERAKYPRGGTRHELISDKESFNRRLSNLPMSPNPLGKAPDDTITTYQGKFDGFAEQPEAFGSPRARNERQKQPYQQNNPHTMRKQPENYVPLDPSRPSDLSHALGKNPSDVIKIGMHHGSSLTKGRSTHYEGQLIEENPLGKNPNDFWSITTQPYPEAHFATYPEAICIKPIKATCPQWICLKCGKPKTRITKHHYIQTPKAAKSGYYEGNKPFTKDMDGGRNWFGKVNTMPSLRLTNVETVGWSSCNCNADFDSGIVLDPMCGSGTTLLAAFNLGRHYIGIELNPSYVELAKKRLGNQCRLDEVCKQALEEKKENKQQ